ncbi:MAG: UDP-2,3-diacylglucosamine diphosphatase [Proteobacteria bacterium]|nr:MAG: UDP-2,3-diacylglucosamine diphosphatase [Pseudomonadota bacterium]
MSQRVWFISDLHLDVKRPHIIQAFVQFLEDTKQQADALYILGDLFEYWIGDDIVDSPAGQLVKPLLAALKQVSDSGIELYFTHGNRDFLVGERFSEMTGCILLPEKHTIDLNGTPTLLMHGDTLCTDDVEYLKLRELFYDVERRQQFLSLSFEERVAEANRLREMSRQKMQYKTQDIMDVNQQAVEQAMTEAGVTQLIHGHTHRRAIHEFELNGQRAKRIVLGDWYEQVSSLKVSEGRLVLG